MADCVAEARWLAGEGVKELIVVAQDPTAYGEDWGKPGSICELLDKLNKVPGLEWIRIMYAYPERITDEFIAAMKRNEKVVPYLDPAHPALQRHHPQEHEPPLQPRRAAGGHWQAAPRDPRHHPAHHPDRRLPARSGPPFQPASEP